MKTFKAALLSLSAALALSGVPAFAATIEPASIALDDFANSAYFTITNDGEAAQTYSLGWKTPPVQKMVRFAPRRVTIEPGNSLIINLLYRKPAGLPDGEYASELLITPEENPERFEKSAQNSDTKTESVKLDAAVSIPVLVKAGSVQPAENVPPAPEEPAQATPAQ